MADTDHLAKDYLFDVRLQPRHLAKGMIDAKALEAHRAALPDLQSEVDSINVEQLTANASARRRRSEGEPDQ